MPGHPQQPADAFAPRLAVFFAASFVAFGIQLPFFPLWLGAKGLDARLIGLALAIPMIVRVFAIPFVARTADRREALRATLIVASVATVIGYTLVGFAEGPVAIIATCALVAVASTPIIPLSDAYALKGLAARGMSYGPVRLWGSAAFIVGTFGAGFAIDSIAARDLIWLIVAGAVVTALAAFALAPLGLGEPKAQPHGTKTASALLWRDPAFVAVVAASSLIQASHAVYYAFSTLEWTAAGLDGKIVAALWALGVVAEIALFALSGRFPRWLGPTMLLMIGGAGGALRWTIMALDPPLAALPALQCMHALSFCAAHLGALGFVSRAAPPGMAATAQGYLSIAMGAVMAASMGLSGVLYANFGSRAYAAMALSALAGGVCAFAAHRLRREAAL